MTITLQSLFSPRGPNWPTATNPSTNPTSDGQRPSGFTIIDRGTQTVSELLGGRTLPEDLKDYVERDDLEGLRRKQNQESLNILEQQLAHAKAALDSSREMLAYDELTVARAKASLTSTDPAIRDRARLDLSVGEAMIASSRNSLRSAEAAWAEASARLQPQIDELMALLGMDKAKA